jgi:hypothetical protein
MSDSAASPFIKASKETLLRQCAEEIREREGEFLAELHMDLHVTLALIGTVQLALRHPGAKGLATAKLARDVINGLIGRMKDAGYVANAELASLGFDPDYDDERDAKPQPAPIEMPASQDKGLKSERDRVAASECVRLMGLLTDSDIPHAKSLATLVGARLATIADEGAGESITLEDIEPWVEIGRQLCIVADVCPCDGPHCIRCGCCAHKACEGGCFWVVPTLCSKCVGVA